MTQDIPLKINRRPFEFFSMTMNKSLPTKRDEYFARCRTNFLIKESEGKDFRTILIEYVFEASFLKDNFEFKAETARPFVLSPFSKITPRGIYRCATICKDEVQDYINTIFSEYPEKPQAKVEPYEELETVILKIIEDFYR